MKRLLILACSATKRAEPEPLPALSRYDGPAYRVVRRFLRDHPAQSEALHILVLSAEFGLFPATTAIPFYDHRMDAARVLELRSEVRHTLCAWVAASGFYAASFINLGRDYWLAMDMTPEVRAALAPTTYAEGGIGERLGQMKQWLQGGAQ